MGQWRFPFFRPRRLIRRGYGLAEPFGLSSALVEPFGSPKPPLPPPAVLELTFAPLLAIGVYRAGHGRIKDKALTEAQSSLG